jgi:glycerate kinase
VGSLAVLVATDKFRGTASAQEIAAAVARAVTAAGGQCVAVPMADGGEGTLDALGGPNRGTTVMGPLGDAVDAEWQLRRTTAVIEMAKASGLALVGGPEGNDPVAATTHGTGELIAAALDAGARKIIVGVGGSATTDGGLGAVRAVWAPGRLRGVDLVVACDVRTRFLDAATAFAPQKGASPAQVALLSRRLDRLAQVYLDDHAVDVRPLVGGGAAGGLAGGLAAVGAELVSGFDVVAEAVDLADHMADADLVVTGEGVVDTESFHGKVVGGVVAMAAEAGVPVLVVGGEVVDGPHAGVAMVSLVDAYGSERSMADTPGCVEAAVAAWLRSSGP